MKLFGMNFGKAEQKSLTTIGISDIINARMSSLAKDKFLLTPYRSAAYYASVSAVGKAIGLISDEIASIKPWLYDMQAEQFVEHKQLEELLCTPNPDKTKSELIKAYASFYLLDGNSFLIALGDVKKAPLELDVTYPDYIRYEDAKDDSYVDYYTYVSKNTSLKFKRSEGKRRFRYYNDAERELWHVKMFNAYAEKKNEGLSPLDIVYYEVEQHLHSSKHNLSTLMRGARLSGMLSIEQELDDPQRANLRNRVDGEWAGASNAGQIAIIDGSKANFSEFSTSMKDMDFLNLKKEVTAAIYNIYSIPLPLISIETMTLDNYKESKFMLYDMAVLPIVARLYEELSLFLLPRFGLDVTRYKIWYDKKDIPALELRRAEELKRKKESGLYKLNELRALEGLDPVDGGDIIYQSMKLVPVGTDMSQLKQPVNTDTIKDRFFEIMKKQMNKVTGERRYSDDVIEEIAKEKGI